MDQFQYLYSYQNINKSVWRGKLFLTSLFGLDFMYMMPWLKYLFI